MRPVRAPDIQAIIYSEPAAYPPIINGAQLLNKAGLHLNILARDYVGATGYRYSASFPQHTRIQRFTTAARASWVQYAVFVWHVWRHALPAARVFLGYDMHGFLPARLLASRYRRPLIYHCHDYVQNGAAQSLGARWVKAFEQRYAKSADLVVAPDRERGCVMRRELQLPRSPITVANSPLNRFDSTGAALHQALSAQGKQFTRIVLRQGRIGPGHAIEATLRSLPAWSSRQWAFVLLGPGDLAYLTYLQEMSSNLGMSEQFAILHPVPYVQVSQFTPGADLGHALYEPTSVNHLYSTTASNKMMEYMAAGLPLLVSDRPAVRDFVEQYQCGLSADECDPVSIADAVNAILGNQELSQRMGKAGREAFEEQFCYGVQYAPVIASVRELLER